MKNILIAVFLSVFALISCEDEVSNKMSSDYPQNGTVTYSLRQVLQYDPMNINGIDVSKKMDFFATVRFTLYYENGKLVKLKYVNGDVPFSPFQFDAASEIEGECELNYDALPNELRIKGTNKVIAYYQDGEFIMPFQLDCASLKYKYTFINIEQ